MWAWLGGREEVLMVVGPLLSPRHMAPAGDGVWVELAAGMEDALVTCGAGM